MRTISPGMQILLDVLAKSRSCAMLGAGASWPIVPIVHELRPLVAKRGLATGAFPVVRIPRDAVGATVLPGPRTADWIWTERDALEEELLHRLTHGAVQAIAVSFLAPRPYQWAPPQYEVFNHTRYRIAIINYNTDGLADRHLPSHLIVNVHGTGLIQAELEALDWEHCIDSFQEFDGPPIVIPNLFLPQPETEALKSSLAYWKVRSMLRGADRLAIVGYSFGGNDDRVGKEAVISALGNRPLPVVVVQPNAYELAGALAEEARHSAIHPLTVYWDSFSSAVIASVTRPRWKVCSHRQHCARCILYLYEAFLDSGNSWERLAEHLRLTRPI
jgi:hypothetical protein